MTFKLTLANRNTIWGGVLIETLIRRDVTHFVISPGSRSTPLTVAVAENPAATSSVHFDERGAAFYALGLVRATGKPAVLICTSGTAVANYLPAIVEAAQDNLPLIVLTADRPPEQWNTGASQTIRQSGIFSNFTRFELTLPAPKPSIPLVWLIEEVNRAVSMATQKTGAGPVHLNCPFEKPLEPTPTHENFKTWLKPIEDWAPTPESNPISAKPLPAVSNATLAGIARRVARSTHGLLVFGREGLGQHGDPYLRLVKLLKWPVMVDIQSPLRSEINMSKLRFILPALAAYSHLSKHWRPHFVLHFGGTLTSQTWTDFLTAAQTTHYIQIHPYERRLDPAGLVTQKITAEPGEFAKSLWSRLSGSGLAPAHFNPTLCKTGFATLQAKLSAGETRLFEAQVIHAMMTILSSESVIFAGNSMPIRDLDSYTWQPVRVIANRGTNGIDGNIATAAGLAHGLKTPVTAILGDLAALHDLNSIALLAQSDFPVRLIILNNQGGGIFSQLPIADYDAVFEPFFGTPHQFQFRGSADQFGLPYQRVDNMAAFKTAIARQNSHSEIIEVHLDRQIQAPYRKSLTAAVHSELARILD